MSPHSEQAPTETAGRPSGLSEDLPEDLPEDLLKLEYQICFTLHSASRAFDSVYREALRGLALTYPQYLTMLVLWEHGDLPVKRIGELLRLDSGTLSPLLKRLEAAGLVQRTRSPLDERSVVVSLTASGESLREKAQQVPRTISAASGLDAGEMADLRDTLQTLIDHLDGSISAAARAAGDG